MSFDASNVSVGQTAKANQFNRLASAIRDLQGAGVALNFLRIATGGAPVAVAGEATFYFDTTLHRMMVSENGGEYAPLVSDISCKIYNSADLTHTNNGNVQALTFDSESFDEYGMHDPSTNPSRITIPVGYGGRWMFDFTTQFAASATGQRVLSLALNGSILTHPGDDRRPGLSNVYSQSGRMSALLDVVAGDYVEAMAFQDSGGDLLLRANAAFAYRL